MKTVWDAETRAEMFTRLDKLRPNQPKLWGQMSVCQMLSHLADPIRAAMGELEVKEKKTPFRFPPLRFLIIYVFPFPKNVPTAPEFLARTAPSVAEGVAELKSTVTRFASRPAHAPFVRHAAFGRMGRKDWGCVMYKHIDHHLRQFGV